MNEVMQYITLGGVVFAIIGSFWGIRVNSSKVSQDSEKKAEERALMKQDIELLKSENRELKHKVAALEDQKHEVNGNFIEVTHQIQNLAEIMRRVEEKVDLHIKEH